MISVSPLSGGLIRSLTFFLVAPPAVKCKKYIALNHYLKKPNHFPVPLSATLSAPWCSNRAERGKKKKKIIFYSGIMTDIHHFPGKKMKIKPHNNENVRGNNNKTRS